MFILRFVLSVMLLFASKPVEPITVIHLESITYPVIARDAQIQGGVTVDVLISSEGQVISAVANSGHPALKQVVEENIKRWKFASGAEQKISIVFEFSLEEPRTAYRSETKNYFDLPSRVRIVITLPARTD